MKVSPLFMEIARSGHVWDILTQSFCPEIKDYKTTKLIIILSLVGEYGKKNRGSQIYLAGDAPHVTSALLQTCASLAQKGLYIHENFSREIVRKLSSGYYSCLIMDNLEQIPETLLDHILTTIQAQNLTSILASAVNYGNYDQYQCPSENIPMPGYLMPLMDFIFIIRNLESFNKQDAAIDLSALINSSDINEEPIEDQEREENGCEINPLEIAPQLNGSGNRSNRNPPSPSHQEPFHGNLKEEKAPFEINQQPNAFWDPKTQHLTLRGLKKYIQCAQPITVQQPSPEIEEYINRWIRNLKKYMNYRLPSNFIANLIYYAGNFAKIHFRNQISKSDIEAIFSISFDTGFFQDLLEAETSDTDLEENPFDISNECINSHFFNEDMPE